MPNRSRGFREIFRAPDPFATESFRLLSENVAAGTDPGPLRGFLMALNLELSETVERGADEDIERARSLFHALLDANTGLVFTVLEGLLNDLELRYHDPLVALVFELAGTVRPLLSLIADVVEVESQTIEGRSRAVEAFVTRSPGLGAGDLEFEAQSMLRLLNAALDVFGKGNVADFSDWHASWLEGVKRIRGLVLDAEAPQGDEVRRPRTGDDLEAASAWADARVALEAVDDAMAKLASAPIQEAVRIVLRILRANSPLPPWHAVPSTPAGGEQAAAPPENGGKKILALIVDKTIQIILVMAGARWRAEVGRTGASPVRRDIVLSPFSQPILEWTLLDSTQAPRTRSAAAGLLRLLAAPPPSMRPSPRVLVYTELFLSSYQGGAGAVTPRGLRSVDSADMLDVLLEVVDDACRWLRRAACEACWSVALEHPGWFQPRHYTRLLPCLSDDDRAIRVSVMRAFQAFAGYRSHRVAALLHRTSSRLGGDDRDDEEKGARHDLEIALGITLDRLVDDVEQLQEEVQGLEARRRDLLDLMERQATRVGEEIHHEVLNALGGYLATAIDEEDYPEAKRRLDDMVGELRRIMNNLYPVDLETEGFLQTIRNRLRAARAQMERRRSGCSVELSCPPEITDEVIRERLGGGRPHLVLLYRIVQEAISNARKHSGGTRIEVRMAAAAAGAIEISTIDNGSGGGGPYVESAGMALMRQRAEEIGATINYATSPGGGTMVVVRLGGPGPGDMEGDDHQARGAPAAR